MSVAARRRAGKRIELRYPAARRAALEKNARKEAAKAVTRKSK